MGGGGRRSSGGANATDRKPQPKVTDEKPPGGASTRLELRSPRLLPTFWPPLPFAPPYEAAPETGPRLEPRAALARMAYWARASKVAPKLRAGLRSGDDGPPIKSEDV